MDISKHLFTKTVLPILIVLFFFGAISVYASSEIEIEMAQGEFGYHDNFFNSSIGYRLKNNAAERCIGILYCALYVNNQLISFKTREISMDSYGLFESNFNFSGQKTLTNPISPKIKMFVLKDSAMIMPISNIRLANLTIYVNK